MDERTRLYVLTALEKRVKELQRDLREECDADVLANYETTGAKSYDALVGSSKVGTYSVRFSKGSTDERVMVDDADALRAWCEAEGLMVPDMDAVRRRILVEGELPDGCHLEATAHPPAVLGTTLRVDPAAVAEVMRDELPAGVAGLLEGTI